MKIAIANLKGGSGKSTTSVQLAGVMSKHHRVLIIDADAQQSLIKWTASREDPSPFVTVAMPTSTIHRDLPAMANDYDQVIIDCPPRLAAVTRSAIMAADLVLIPLSPSSFDLQATEELISLLDDAKVINPDMEIRFLINRAVVGASISRAIATELKTFDQIPLLKTVVHQRVVIAESAGGYLINELDPDGKAMTEYRRLYNEIMKLQI